MICDSHAHLDHGEAFDHDRESVLLRARRAGVAAVLNVATSPADAAATVATARGLEGVWGAVGIHPHEAAACSPATLDDLAALAADPVVVAWGEIGLDYHYMHAPRPVQREAFARQLERAGRLGLPVSVHSREADGDTIDLIRRHAGPAGGVIHCFTGGWDLARACLDLGFHISFSGILTFPGAGPLRAVAARVPAERLLVETDSPYLAPAPRRGGRNEPARVVEVLECLARTRGVSATEMAATTTASFEKLFGVKVRTDGPPPASSSPPG